MTLAFPVACVVDASVVIKLFLQEEDSDLATVLMAPQADRAIVRAMPELLYLECSNILRTRVHCGLLTPDEARLRVARLAALPLAQ